MARNAIALLVWGSFSFAPVALAQINASTTAACFQLTSTNDTKIALSSLLTKEAATQALPIGTTSSLFIGKDATEQKLCYGPFDSINDAALFAVGWADSQPLSPLKIRVSGFSLFSYVAAPDKKGEAKLGASQSFSVATAAFTALVQESLERKDVHVGVIAPAKSYGFSAPDAFMPAFEDDTLELTRDQNLLSLGQESWCEESSGCLFWDKVLVGDVPQLAYIPSGHVIFPDQFIAAPDNSWKLFARARGSIPFVPEHRSSVNNPSPTANSAPTIVVSVWALGNAKESFDSLGNIEVPGASPDDLVVHFIPEGIALQSKEPNSKAASLAINKQKYKTVDSADSTLATTDNNTPSVAPSVAEKPSEKAPAKKPAKPAVKYYTIRKGDSLWLISSKFGVSVEALRKANKLSKKSILQPGQKIVIPGKGK